MKNIVLSEIMSNFSESLKDIMITKNLTVKEICKATEFTKQSLYGWLSKKTLPRLSNLLILSNFFQCSIDYLLNLSKQVDYQQTFATTNFFTQFEKLFKDTKLSLREFSRRTSIPTSSITHWRHGHEPETFTLIQLANFFDCSVEFLIGRTSVR